MMDTYYYLHNTKTNLVNHRRLGWLITSNINGFFILILLIMLGKRTVQNGWLTVKCHDIKRTVHV
jgi:hypothetical protein